MPRIPWTIRLLDAAGRAWGEPIVGMDEDAIARARRRVDSPRPPVSWVTGAVPPAVAIRTVQAPGRSGHDIPIRLYRPLPWRRASGPTATPATDRDRPATGAGRQGRPLVVFFHGGGWVLGNVAGYDALVAAVCVGVDALVASVDYRLAPEAPAPAGLEDCLDATQWLFARAEELGVDPARIAVCGDSAGGNLAAVVAQACRDAVEEGRPAPRLAAQALIYPAVDSTRLSRSKMLRARGPILSRRDTDAYLAHYLGTAPEGLSPHDVRVSPALGRVDGLPPTLIQTADLDPLRDEGLAYGRRLADAGVPVVVTNYPRAVHGFASFPGVIRGGWDQRRELVAYLRAVLRPRPGQARPSSVAWTWRE